MNGNTNANAPERRRKRGNEMSEKKLRKMARRALQWAEMRRSEGDMDGEAMAMRRWRAANRKLGALIADAFAPRMDFGTAMIGGLA